MVRRGRRYGWWALAVVALLVALAAGAAWSPLLDVESVEVVGVTGEQAAAATEAAGVDVGEPILTFLPSRAAGHVRALPWVADARVVRELPGTVRIEVVARAAVGWTQVGAGALVVDRAGRVIERLDAPPLGLPELTGVADVAAVGGRIAPVALPAAAGALGPELRDKVATVSLDDGAISAQVVFGPQLRFGLPEQIALKARVAAAVLASLGPDPVGYVDVSVPAAPVSG